MKKLFTFFVFLIAFASAYSQIPNPSFETWTTYASGEYPTYWATSDSAYIAAGGAHSAVREVTDICDSSNSLKLTSVTILFTNTGPGVATNGKITGVSTIVGGSPFTARPLLFTGCYKYIPSGSDTGRVSALLARWNGTSRDTIALAYSAVLSVPSLTNFQFNFVYRDLVNLPDTILIVLSSGRGVNQTNAGSVLTVDNLSTSGILGVNETSSIKNISIYPQPAQNELNFNLPSNIVASLGYEVRDLIGKLAISGEINSSNSKIDINPLRRGSYFIVLRNEEGAVIYSSKFSVAK